MHVDVVNIWAHVLRECILSDVTRPSWLDIGWSPERIVLRVRGVCSKKTCTIKFILFEYIFTIIVLLSTIVKLDIVLYASV